MDGFDHAGLHFAVHETGDADGPPVVLLHGFPQQPASWDAVAALLHADGLRTLVPTQRGYASEARPSHRRDYALTALASDVVALLDHAGLSRAHIVGHDWGGFQAWAVAGLHPDRVVSTSVLSTPHPAAMRAALLGRQALRSWYMAFFQLPYVPERVAARTLRRTLADSGLPDAQVDAYVTAMAEPGALTAALNWYRGMPFSFRTPVPTVRVPTTYVWGRHDFALGRVAAEKTAEHVSGPYAFVELDAGHWLPETEPVAVATAIAQRVLSTTD